MYGSNKVKKEKNDRTVSRRMHTFMSQEDVASGKKSTWCELEISGVICSLSPHLFDLSHLTSLYLNNNNIQELPAEITRLQSLTCLDVSDNKLMSLPAELGELIQLRELLLENNHIQLLPFELGKLFQLQTLGLGGNPLQQELMSIYVSPHGTQNLLSFLLDNLTVTATMPPQRPWIPMSHPDSAKPVAIFTVMCYNILCDQYATRQIYGYCPSWALNWEYRKKLIIDEIRQYSADIISLQEVETDQFYNYFLPELKTNGYDGVFAPKSRARTMSENERKHVDGCAIFYQTSKFSLVKDHLIEFNQLAISAAEGSHDMINRVMTKDNIGLAALLETKEAVWENSLPEGNVRQPLLVGTCHVHWDPEFCDVKLIQTMMLMSELKNIIQDSQTSLRPGSSVPDCNSVPLILCGDLNSLPDSGVVDFLNASCVSAKHEDFKGLGYEDCLRKLSMSDNKDVYTHGFHLSQAYNGEVMPYTNYTYDFKGIIDYIFFSRDFIHPLGILGPLDSEWFRENKVSGCPHPRIPSDHFPLLTELEMAASSSSSGTGDSRRGNAANMAARR